MTTRHTTALALLISSSAAIALFVVHAPEKPGPADAVPAHVPVPTAATHPSSGHRNSAAVVDPIKEMRPDPVNATSQTTLAAPPVAATEVRESLATLTIIATSTTQYALSVPDGTVLLEAMRTLASSSSFSFTTREYPGMGAYVDSIQGLAARDGYYWILYYRGKTADAGASSLVLHAGDAVEWRYEAGY